MIWLQEMGAGVSAAPTADGATLKADSCATLTGTGNGAGAVRTMEPTLH